MIKLKVCPFCGGKPILREWNYPEGPTYTIECSNCYVDVGEYQNKESLIKLWNTRVSTQQIKSSG